MLYYLDPSYVLKGSKNVIRNLGIVRSLLSNFEIAAISVMCISHFISFAGEQFNFCRYQDN